MSSSFHNAEPRSRAERLAAHDKEQRERGMLRTRRGGFQSTSCELGSPVVPEPGSPLWEAEQSRFSGDAAAEIRQQKLEAQRKQQVGWLSRGSAAGCGRMQSAARPAACSSRVAAAG